MRGLPLSGAIFLFWMPLLPLRAVMMPRTEGVRVIAAMRISDIGVSVYRESPLYDRCAFPVIHPFPVHLARKPPTVVITIQQFRRRQRSRPRQRKSGMKSLIGK